ncbi:hypothetical protein ACTJKB_09510 [Paenibacillus sp. 22594]
MNKSTKKTGKHRSFVRHLTCLTHNNCIAIIQAHHFSRKALPSA